MEATQKQAKQIRIALAGNPNCGKTTLFNALTGSNQFVGNWPGVTVEKKEGKLKKHDGVIVTDLPGIYSLSPYTLEEVVARNYLIGERPDAILNLVDGTNLERNLYLTTQLTELGIPVVVAINMMDVVKKNGDKIDTKELARSLGCQVYEISALKGTGIIEAAEAAIEAAKSGKTVPMHTFSGTVEHALAHIEEVTVHDFPEEQQRWYSIKLFERDEKVREQLKLAPETLDHIEADIKRVEEAMDDDAEAIITNERYIYIGQIMKTCYKKKDHGKLSTSDKIDRVVTNRWLGLPIFAAIMFLVYWISMIGVGSAATDWANDGLFGDGWHLFGIGSGKYEEAAEEYGDADQILDALIGEYADSVAEGDKTLNPSMTDEEVAARASEVAEEMAGKLDLEAEDFSEEEAKKTIDALRVYLASLPAKTELTYELEDEETLEVTEEKAGIAAVNEALDAYLNKEYKEHYGAPATEEYGVWVPGIPVLIGNGLEKANAPEWLNGLVLDGIVAGVGAVLGFVPQMLVLFFLLAFLEACGYMARIAFVLDRIFRRFGLSGKSFIPMLIGSGCGVPGIMASRTIENERDRRMTIMTTTFIPCGAKVPFIAMIAGAIFGGSALVATSAYFIGVAAIIISGVMLKKTRMFAGDPAPFVMELPAYHMPTFWNVLRSMWERGWAFIKKAGTIILLSTMAVWFFSYFGFVDGGFRMLAEEELDQSMLAVIGKGIAWIFAPLGWGNWRGAVASITGLIAKENIVGTMGVLYSKEGATVYSQLAEAFTGVAAYSFLIFNLLCAPCFAAIGAIRREMNSAKWTWFAIGYQCGFAYAISLIVYQIGSIFNGEFTNHLAGHIIGLVVAVALIACMVYMLFFKKYKEATTLSKKI